VSRRAGGKEIVMKAVTPLITLACAALLVGCASPGYQNNASLVNQAALGTAIGAGLGMIAGNNISGINREQGALIGGIAGGLIGAQGGRNADVQRRNYEENRVASAAAMEMASTVVINVTNSNGSMTPVTLRRVGNQYLGSRGEYYASLPSEEQLRIAYGF